MNHPPIHTSGSGFTGLPFLGRVSQCTQCRAEGNAYSLPRLILRHFKHNLGGSQAPESIMSLSNAMSINGNSGPPFDARSKFYITNQLSSLGVLQTDKVVSWQASLEQPQPEPEDAPLQEDSPIPLDSPLLCYENEGWVEAVHSTIKPAPQGPASPSPGSLWTSVDTSKPTKKAIVVQSGRSQTGYRLNQASPVLWMSTKRFCELYREA